MNFKDALYEVLDNILPKENDKENVVDRQTVKILSLMWNMLAVSKKELDDLVHIDENNNIKSVPIENLQKSSTKTTAGKKAKAKEEVNPVGDVEENNESTTK